MQGLRDDYVELMNGVLAVNYYGEVLTVELIASLIRRKPLAAYRETLSRQLLDETRHANTTRRLLLDRGRDPLVADTRADFTFHEIFKEYSGRSEEELIAFLATNENVSSRNFSEIIRIARSVGDAETASLYSEILNDEVRHSHSLFEILPDGEPKLAEVKADAFNRMTRLLNPRYFQLFLEYRRGYDGQAKASSAAQ